MLPLLLRRLFWTVPTLLLVSLASFLFLSFVPDPTDDEGVRAGLSPEEVRLQRRERFVDLPRFLNVAPLDVKRRALAAVAEVAAGGNEAEHGSRELVRLGAAALPHVIPALDAFSPDTRTRIALSLAPIATRMHLHNNNAAAQPETAALFWTRVWTDRNVEFSTSAVRTAVERLARYRTVTRAEEVEELDTFALEAIMLRLQRPENEADIEVARALVDVLAHATGRADRIEESFDLEQTRDCIERWRAFWFIYGTDYKTVDGAGRASALVLETRYGKWAHSVVTSFAAGAKTAPGMVRVARGAPTTFTIVFGAIFIAYAIGVGLGIISAVSRGRNIDLVIATTVLAAYSVPTALVAVAIARMSGPTSHLVLPTLIVALGLVATPTRHQRAALAATLSSEFVRSAVARGAGRWRAVVVHGLRSSLVPVITLATLEPPMALGAAFVVEHVFGLRGLGALTIEAVSTRDTGYLMALSVVLAGVASVAVVVTDVAHALVDPRTRHKLARGRT